MRILILSWITQYIKMSYYKCSWGGGGAFFLLCRKNTLKSTKIYIYILLLNVKYNPINHKNVVINYKYRYFFRVVLSWLIYVWYLCKNITMTHRYKIQRHYFHKILILWQIVLTILSCIIFITHHRTVYCFRSNYISVKICERRNLIFIVYM